MPQEKNPYQAPKLVSGLPYAIIAMFIGALAGGYALTSGAHGGSIWPTAILSGPVCLVAQAFGDRLYVFIMWAGTSAIYGIYGLIAATRPRMLPIAFVVHAVGSAILIILALARG